MPSPRKVFGIHKLPNLFLARLSLALKQLISLVPAVSSSAEETNSPQMINKEWFETAPKKWAPHGLPECTRARLVEPLICFVFSAVSCLQRARSLEYTADGTRFRSCFVFMRRSHFGPDGMPCVVLWRPEALDCRMPTPPETWNGFVLLCLFLWLGKDLSVSCPVWDSNPRPPAADIRHLGHWAIETLASDRGFYPQRVCKNKCKKEKEMSISK